MSYVGSVELTRLNKVGITNLKGEDCIVIPLSYNPSIKPYVDKETGKKRAFLNVFLKESYRDKETREHYIFAASPKEARESLAPEQMKEFYPFLGSVKSSGCISSPTPSTSAPNSSSDNPYFNAAQNQEQRPVAFNRPAMNNAPSFSDTEDLPF